MKNKYLTNVDLVVCGRGEGTVGNYCPEVGVNITLFPGNVCVDKKVGNIMQEYGILRS